MTRKLGLSVGLPAAAMTLALVFSAGAMAQSQSNAVPASYNDANRPGGASTSQPAVSGDNDAHRPSGSSTNQIPMSDHQSANRPGG